MSTESDLPSGSTDASLAAGTQVGEYVVEAQIGTGTFGSVYRAIQPLIGKQVAIKVLSAKYSADPPTVSRFIAEARAVNQIRHKNLIDIFSFGQLPDGRHYHVMELLEGLTLEDILRQQDRLSPEDIFMVLRGLTRALDAAHAAGIAHRDLKPANVFIARDEEGQELPKLLDFGIAKLLTDEVPRQHTTATGAAVGTPDYMSPEQCKGKDVDHRTDIYAFGVLTYRLLVGKLPFTGDNVVEVLMKHMTEDPPPPSTVNPETPVEFDAPVLAMLHKNVDERPNSLREALTRLEEAAEAVGWDIPASSASHDALLPPGPLTPNPSSPFADTLSSGAQPELHVEETTEGKRPWALILGLGAMAAAVLAIPFLLDSAEELADPPIAQALPPPTEPPRVAPPVEPPAKAEPTTVRLFFSGAPDGTKVFGPGDVELGAAPGSIEFPVGSEALALVFRAPGYRELTRSVKPVATGTISVTLKRLGRKPRRKPVRKPPPKKPGKDTIEEPDWE